ncbi:MAG: hypothetical protein ACLP0J_11330 [Solirubrobacteraceae bacterium]
MGTTAPSVHASLLNQGAISFSILPAQGAATQQLHNFTDLHALEQHLLAFGRRYEQIARPFEWKFTRHDLDRVLAGSTRLDRRCPHRKPQRDPRNTSRHRTSRNFSTSDPAGT